MKKTAVVILIIFAVYFGWFLGQPQSLEEEAESQDTPINWEDAVVMVVQNIGPSIVKIETVREVVTDQFFFQSLEEQQGIGSQRRPSVQYVPLPTESREDN